MSKLIKQYPPIASKFKMTNRLRKKSQRDLSSAMQALEKAFLEELARQERARQVEEARRAALYEREMTLQGANPVVWPATMMQQMPRYPAQFTSG
jgi:hypothetical protein